MWDQVLAALSFELAKLSLSIEPKSKPPRPFIQLKRVETTGGTVPGGTHCHIGHESHERWSNIPSLIHKFAPRIKEAQCSPKGFTASACNKLAKRRATQPSPPGRAACLAPQWRWTVRLGKR